MHWQTLNCLFSRMWVFLFSLSLVVFTGDEEQLGYGDGVWSVAAAKLKFQYVCGLITHMD